jgi:hypothetical protein
MKQVPTNVTALHHLEQALQDTTWRVHWDAHAQRFSTSFTEALRGPLRSLGVGTSVAVAYTAARSAVALAPAAYHETWARVSLALLVREALRNVGGACTDMSKTSEALADEVGRITMELSSAAERIGARPVSDDTRARSEPFIASAHESLARAREQMLGDAPRPFLDAYFDHVKQGLPLLASRDTSSHALLRSAVLQASQAARKQNDPAWAAMPAWARKLLVRRCLAETAAALVEGVPNALAQSAQGGNREGKDASMALGRAACLVLSCLSSVEGWVWEVEREVEPPAATPVEADGQQIYPPVINSEKVEKKMTMPKPPIVKTLQNDAVDAAWRTAASQFVKLTREPLVALLSRHLGPEDASVRNKIAAFLETEVGTALLTSVLSVGLSAMPGSTGEAPVRLARELRVKAMTDMGDVVADVLMGPLRQVMSIYLQDMPANLPELPSASPPELTQGTTVGSTPTAERERIKG